MLEYEWNTHLLSGDDHVSSDPSDHHHRHFYDPFTDPTHLLPQNQTQIPTFQSHPQFTPLNYYDSTQLLNHDPSHYIMVPKPEPEFGFRDPNRIGLNLGGRTYFSSAESDFVNRLYRRSRPMEGGSGNVVARCQAEGCCADLTHAKHYHRRHKVCEFHSKASAVVAAGITQRFCQQCSRFHLLTEFDNGKRSCRKRLADHNRRRRKSNNQANTNQEQPQHQQQTPNSNSENALVAVDSPSDNNLTRSPQDSGTQSTSSVTMAISPPRFSLDCFRQRSYQAAAAATSSPSTSSLFFSNG